MDTHAFTVLEFPELLELVAEHAASASGRTAILELRPYTRLNRIRTRRALAQEFMALRDEGIVFPRVAFPELSESMRRVRPVGAVLGGEELLGFRELLAAVEQVLSFGSDESCKSCVRFRSLLSRMDPCSPLRRSLARSLDEEGELVDGASPALARARQRIKTLGRRITRMLEGLLADGDLGDVFQERFVTLRNGRQVVPVRRSSRNRVPGVVHDHSDSGQTVFVEPSGAVELGNELASARLEERDECRRIMAELSDRVRGCLVVLIRNQKILARVDAAAAISAWAVAYGCTLPRFSGELYLRQARHPLLAHQLRQSGGGTVVPLDLTLDPACRALIVTGSNSGGKTVALKTVGLLMVAAQCGLPIPVAEDSELPLLEQVFADIGDEQSLSQNLSTFTGHLTRIVGILRARANCRTLVLLDELGTGTDPLEGGALACAVLAALAERPWLTLATTHLGVIKSYAHEHPAMVNGAVRFNPDTLQPTYILEVGRPGASHALTIARRLGMPAAVLAQADTFLESDQLQLESLLAKLEEQQREAAKQEAATGEHLAAAKRNRENLGAELDALRQERRRLVHEAHQEASRLVSNTRVEMERLISSIRKQGQDERAESDRCAERDARRRLEKREKALARAIQETSDKPVEPLPMGAIKLGQSVWVEKLKANGTVKGVSPDQKQITVTVGRVDFAVKAREIGRSTEPVSSKGQPVVKVSLPKVDRHVPSEINLIGKTCDQGVPLLDSFLSQAALAGLEEVRVIHGFGTGRLMKGVHEYLRGSRQVLRFRIGEQGKDPGGGGATVVTLR